MANPIGGETNVPVGDWTTGTLKINHDEKIAHLKEYLEQLIKDQDKYTEAKFLAIKEAVLKAETANDKRFDSVNEFRQQLNDQTNTFLSRNEYNAQHKALEDRVSDITDRLNKKEGADKGTDVTWGKMVTLVSVVGAILAILVMLSNGIFK